MNAPMPCGQTAESALVNLARYPILDLDAPAAQAVVTAGRAALMGDGLCTLPEFIGAEALTAMAGEARRLVPRAYRRDVMMGIWRGEPDGGLPADHPRRRKHRSRHGTIAYDLFGPDSAIRRLYEWPALTRFVAALTGSPELHTCADPLAACVVTVLGDGDAHAWHYDDNDFVVSLLLQAAESGGRFEYAPNLRTESDENYDRVRRVLDGDRELTVTGGLEPGTLALFRGQRSLHHVTPASGRRERLIALFSYDRRPGMTFSSDVHLSALGRTLATKSC